RKKWIRLHFGTSAAVLPVTSNRELVLTREYRHGLGRIVFSLPGGTAKTGETAEACARRELLEETGYESDRLLEMYAGNNLTAYLEGTLHLYLAKDARPTGREPNPDEIASVERMSVTKALASARSGEFESAVVTLAILMADARGWLIG
ncbi:MAG: NUDIX hydrolase, partial [Thermoplasmata archaeon]|nr:NUDIX hydrolase [Thermoplasmata archaeon]